MESVDVAPTSHPTANALIAALLSADAVAIADCFTDGARLRALTPPGLRERHGAAEIGELMSSWFADCSDLALVETTASEIADRTYVRYRFTGMKDGRGQCVIEQQLYADEDRGHFVDVALVCSGFRPIR